MSMKKLICSVLLPALLLLVASSSHAQTKSVSGRITDANDSTGLPNASVVVKGGKTGTKTNADGTFTLTVPTNATTLEVSAVGYATQDVSIGDGNIEVRLSTSASANLNEVVVVGYGGVKRKDLTGAVASVTAKDFNKGQINSPEQLLQGKVAGLQITNSSGQPGGLTIVKIRGNNSIRAGNTPLYVVDGVPLDGRTARPDIGVSGVGTSPASDALSFINPNEIAQVEVLKDASASAIYGSRGANGVILITTKKGSSGPAKIDVNANFGFGDVMRTVDVLSADGYRSAIKQYDAPNSDSGKSINPWESIIRNQSITQNYSVAMSGGNESSKYRASFFMGDQDGVILKTNLRKYVGNFNGQFKFLDKRLTIDFGGTVSNVRELIAPISQDAGSGGNLISLALIWNPTLEMVRKDGTYNQENPSGQVNPMALSAAYNDVANTTTLLANVNAAFKFTDWLEYRFLYGTNYGNGTRKAEIQGWIKGTGGNADGKGLAGVFQNELFSQTITHTLNFQKDLSSDFNLNAVVGYEYWKTNYRGTGTSVYDFTYNLDQKNLNNIHYYDNIGAGKQANLSTYSFRNPITEVQSYFARAVLNWRDRFIFTGTIRADGSNKFGSDNKYAYFPSAAVAWNITNEDFMKGNTLFDALKLRLGYGVTGNQEFAADAALDVYTFGYNSLNTQHFGNPALKWESVQSIDAGVDFQMFKGRFYGAIDYFDKKTKDPIFLKVIAQPTGAGGVQYVNLTDAEVRNHGVEVSLGADVIQGKDFSWSISGNVTFVKNLFSYPPAGTNPLALTGALHGQGTSGAYSQAIANDQPINVFYLPVFQGFDKDGIGIYSPTPQYTGDPNPQSFIGFSTDLTYKKWSLNLAGHGSFGNKLYNNTAMSVLNISNINGGRNIASGLVTSGESTANPITTSTRYLESGDFVKLSNATLRYTFGNVGRVFKGFSVYVSANNLFVISKYKGFDPEVNVDKALNGIPSLGIDYIGYPTQRTILGGLSFTL